MDAVGVLRIERRDVPRPGPGEVLVQVRSVGVCGSDVHFFEHGRIGLDVVEPPQLARYASEQELLTAVESFDGQLATGLHADPHSEPELTRRVATSLAARCGRIVFDGFPTGVAVTWAMQHGGPYPATTTPGETSVGMTATRRFMRPVCWQDAPQAMLPEPLRDANPHGLWRRIDGRLTREAVTG